jgi:membrane protein required for colicin V production
MTHSYLPDLIALGLVVISILISLARGFVKELISVLSWVLAAWLSVRHSQALSKYITFTDVQSLRVFLAFLIIFVVMVFIGATFNFMIGQFVRKTPFSAADRVLGMVFGAVRGVLILSVLVLLGGLTALPRDTWWQDSYAIEKVQKISIWMKGFLPSEVAHYFNFSPQKKSEKDTSENA